MPTTCSDHVLWLEKMLSLAEVEWMIQGNSRYSFFQLLVSLTLLQNLKNFECLSGIINIHFVHEAERDIG